MNLLGDANPLLLVVNAMVFFVGNPNLNGLVDLQNLSCGL